MIRRGISSTLHRAFFSFSVLLLVTGIGAQSNGWSDNNSYGSGSGSGSSNNNNVTGGGTAETQQQLDCSFRRQPIELIANVLSVQHIINPEKGTLTVELTYNGEGWVAFGTSPDGKMIGGQVVIAMPDEAPSATNPGKYNLNQKSDSGIVLSDQQTLINATFEQLNGQTILRYTKLLVESGENAITADASNTFIFAVGSTNTFGYHGGMRGSVSLNLNQVCVTPGEQATGNNNNEGNAPDQDDGTSPVVDVGKTPNKSLWIAHGILMAISWAILLPIGIGFSLLRKLVPGTGVWFKLHAGVNTLAFLLMTAGFAIAVSQTDDGSHFVDLRHRTIGLVIYILSFLQVVGGIFRPHLPHASAKQAEESDYNNPVVTKDLEASNPGDPTESTAAPDATTAPLPPKSTARVVFEWGHRLFGYGLLGLSWYNLYLGILALVALFGSAYDKTAALWGVIGGLSGFILVLYVGQTLYSLQKQA